jgi:MFS family permease
MVETLPAAVLRRRSAGGKCPLPSPSGRTHRLRLAQSVMMLDLARALQGVGGSLVLTAALAIINHAFAKQERAKAYAIWGAYVGIAIVGGVVTGFFGWRWSFLINLPICLALFIAIAAFVSLP